MKPLQNNKITKFLLISFLISWGFGWGLLAFLTQMGLLSLTSPLGSLSPSARGHPNHCSPFLVCLKKSIKSIVFFYLRGLKEIYFLISFANFRAGGCYCFLV